jgi:stage V sporulation protein R
MMTQLAPLNESEIVDSCDHYAGVVATHGGRLNPYKLGVELLRHVEKRWDEGKFGIDYINCDDPKVRREWNTQAGLGRQKIFEVRKFHNDITFIDEFLDEDFCHQTKMFIYDVDPKTGRQVISSRDFGKIKQQLLSQITNFGQPLIDIVDANFKNRGELLLTHQFSGVEIKHDYAIETLKCLYRIWNRPVHIETWSEDSKKRITWDGQTSSIEKA